MEEDAITGLTSDAMLVTADVPDTPSADPVEPPSIATADQDVNGEIGETPLAITKSIKVSEDIEIPIHIPIAQPIETASPQKGRRKLQTAPNPEGTDDKDSPTKKPAPPLLIKSVNSSVADPHSMVESVLSDPSIQEMLKHNPGHTLTLVRLPDSQVPQMLVGRMPNAGELLASQQTFQVLMPDQEAALLTKTPRKKRRKRKIEEPEEVSEEEGEKEAPKVTRSGRVVKPPSYTDKHYVGRRGKTLKAAEEAEEGAEPGTLGEGDEEETGDNNMEEDDISVDPDSIKKPVNSKRGRGRPRKSPKQPQVGRPVGSAAREISRYQVSRVAKGVNPWDFMLMRVIARHRSSELDSFYGELLQEFKTVVASMKRFSNRVLQQDPALPDPSEESTEATVELSEELAKILGQVPGQYMTDPPTRGWLPKRVLKWLGPTAAVFPRGENEEEEEAEDLSADGLDTSGPTSQEGGGEIAESLLQAVGAVTGETNDPVASALEDLKQGEDMQVQGAALVPPGSVIMEMENGTFMAETPTGATMEIQAPENMGLEALSALLDQAAGAMDPSNAEADAVVKDHSELTPATNPKTMIGDLQVKRSISLSSRGNTKPATILLQS